MTNFPITPDTVTATWLSDVLGFTVKDFKVIRFAEGTGILSMVTRVQLVTAPINPQSIIAKFPSPDISTRAITDTYGMYAREVMFYQSIADKVELRTPRCLYTALDPENNNFIMLLEDLGHLAVGDHVSGCTLTEAKYVLSALARLHAGTWQASEFPDLISHNNPNQVAGQVNAFQVGWPKVNKLYPELIPESAQIAGEKMPGAVARLVEEMCQEPICISHGDARLDNIFFDGDECVFVDMQSVATSAPEHDVSYFITQSVPSAVRQEEDLVAFYHSELTSLGIDYDLARCRTRYRVSALYLMCFAVSIAGELDLQNERGEALGRVVLGNAMRALDDIDAFDLLR
jgi:hypothetical protein|tara:strand:+ start:452 stop:1486 length:1035 start_codon:yes stop_codon:yes gene_type:complete